MDMAFAFFITGILIMITIYIFFEKWKPFHLLLSRIQNNTVPVSTSVAARQYGRQMLAQDGNYPVFNVAFPQASLAFPNQVPKPVLISFIKVVLPHLNTRMNADSFAAEDWSSRIDELLHDVSNAHPGRTEFEWLRTLRPNIADARGKAFQFIYVQYTDRPTQFVDEEREKVWVACAGGGWLPHDFVLASTAQLIDALNGVTSVQSISSEILANIKTGLYTAQMVEGILVMKPTIELVGQNSQQTSEIELAKDVECIVCRDSFKEGEKLRKLGCRHLFHRSCIDKVRNPAIYRLSWITNLSRYVVVGYSKYVP